MQKRAGLLTVFLIFFLLSLSLFLLFTYRQQTAPFFIGIVERVTFPIQNSLYSAFIGALPKNKEYEELRNQNRELAKQIVDQSDLAREAKALRDQYDTEVVSSQQLVPARVIGMKSFIPGVSLPEQIVLDKGAKHNLKKGQSVILTNNIVGIIVSTTDERSLVSLITNTDQSLTAETNRTQAVGIIKGKGNGKIVFENVVLSDSLEKGDIVVTKGESDVNGEGYYPGFVVGKVASVDKKASDLFQTAEVESLIDFTALKTVFIISDKQ